MSEQGGMKDTTTEQLQQHFAGCVPLTIGIFCNYIMASSRPLPGPSSNFTFTTTPGPELPAATVPPHVCVPISRL